MDCNAAVQRFVNSVDIDAIGKIINSIPEAVGTLAVMPEIQKEFYLKLMQIRLDNVLKPAAEELRKA